jgi:DNA polymerase-3 subunit alpha
VLSSDMNHTDKVVAFIDDCRLQKITLLPPNVNQSLYKFSVDENNRILYGLGAIKGVGEAAIVSIIEARKTKPFQDIFDFCARVDGRRVSRRVLEALIRAGAFDCFGEERSTLMANLDDAVSASEQLMKNLAQGQEDLFGGSLSASDILITSKQREVEPWSDTIRLQGEKETLGLYLTGHPLEQYEKELRSIVTTVIRDLRPEKNRKHTIAGI